MAASFDLWFVILFKMKCFLAATIACTSTFNRQSRLQQCPSSRSKRIFLYAYSIWREPVTVENLQHWSVANSYLAYKGQEIVANTLGILSDASGEIGANGWN